MCTKKWLKAVIGVAIITSLFAVATAYDSFHLFKGKDIQTNSFGSESDPFYIVDKSHAGQQVNSNSESIEIFAVHFVDAPGGNFQGLDVKLVLDDGASVDVDQNTSNILKYLPAGLEIWKSEFQSDSLSRNDRKLSLNNNIVYEIDGANYRANLRLVNADPIEAGDVYFLALKTAQYGVVDGSRFQIGIVQNGTKFGDNQSVTHSEVLSQSIQMDANRPKLVKLTADGLLSNAGTHLSLFFDQAIDLTTISWATVEGGYSPDAILNAQSIDTYLSHSYGTGAVAAFVTNYVSNDKVIITLGGSPTIANDDRIWPSFCASNYRCFNDAILLDTNGPTLKDVVVLNDIGANNQFTEVGEKIMLVFDKDVDQNTLRSDNINTRITLSQGTWTNFVTPALVWMDDNILQVTLNAEQTNSVGAEVTLSPDIKDLNGNGALNFNPKPRVRISAVSRVPYVELSDNDSTNSGIDGNDITVAWSEANIGDHVNVYILPADEVFDNRDNFNPINSSSIDISEVSYDGTDSAYYIQGDSRSDYDNFWPYYYFMQDQSYKAVVEVCNAEEIDCLTTESSPINFTPDNNFDQGFFEDNNWRSTFVEGTIPYSYSTINTNNKVFVARFSAPMDSTTITDETITLRVLNGDYIAGTVSYNSDELSAIFKTDETLTANSTLVFEVLNAEDSNGVTVSYTTNFYTNNSADTEAPTIWWAEPNDEEENVNTLLSNIKIGFSEMIDPTTLLTNSWVATPEISASSYYEPMDQSLVIEFNNSALQANTSYQITLLGSVIKDSAGNNLDGDDNEVAGGNYVLNFNTQLTANTSAPTVKFTDFLLDGFRIGLDLPMKNSPLITVSNYTLVCDNMPVSLANATFDWDSDRYELQVFGIPLAQDQDCFLNLSTNIVALNNQPIIEADRTQEGSTHMERGGNDFYQDFSSGEGGMMGGAEGSGDWFKMSAGFTGDVWDDKYVQKYNPMNAWAECNIAGCTTDYNIEFPITQALNNGYKIQVVFPTGYNVSNAEMDDDWMNNDINQWDGAYLTAGTDDYSENGRIYVTDATVSQSTRSVTLTIAIDADNDGDVDTDAHFGDNGSQVSFKLKNITNPSTVSSSYQINVNTLTNSDQTIEEISLNPVWLSEPGDGSVTVTVLNSTDDSPIANATVYINAPGAGTQETLTNGSGQAIVTGIPVGSWDAWGNAWTDCMEAPEGYVARCNNGNFTLSESNPSAEVTFYFDEALYTVSGTITHTGIGTEGSKHAQVWAGCSNSWVGKRITLDADGSTAYSLSLSSGGFCNIGIDKWYGSNGGAELEFVSPPPTSINVDGDETVNLALIAADKFISGTVVDDQGSALANAWVQVTANQQKGDMSFWAGGQTNKSGAFRIAVAPGQYKVMANVPGIFSQTEMNILVPEEGANVPAVLNFVIKQPSIAISGSITDNSDNPIQWSNVNCWSNNGFGGANAMTDSNGEYTLFVNAGTYNCEAWAPMYGKVPVADGSDASDVSIASDATINFKYDPDAFAEISGIIHNANGDPYSYNWVMANKVNSTTGQWTGPGNGASTDSTGAFRIIVEKNQENEVYELRSWNGLGEVTIETDIDVSEANAELGTITLPQRYDVALSILNFPNTNMDRIFMDLQNTTTRTMTWADCPLTDGDCEKTVSLDDGDYMLRMFAPGIGGLEQEFTVDGAETSVEIDFSDYSMQEFTVTVEDSNGDPVPYAFINAFSPASKIFIDAFTDGNGEATLNVVSGYTYMIQANKPNYISSNTQTTTGTTSYIITMQEADATITGTVVDSEGDPMPYAWVDANNTDNQWTNTGADGSGEFTLYVSEATTWDLTAHGMNGTWGETTGVVAGDTSVEVALDQTIDYFEAHDPINSVFEPEDSIAVEGDFASFSAEAGALGDDTISLGIEVTTGVSEGGATGGPLGNIGVDFTATDTNDTAISNFDGDGVVTLEYSIDQIEGMIDAGIINDVSDATDLPLGYYDTSSQSWVMLDSTSTTIECQENSGDDYEHINRDTFNADYDTEYSTWNDCSINYSGTTDHFTIFAPIIEDEAVEEEEQQQQQQSSNGNGGAKGTLTLSEVIDQNAETTSDSHESAGDENGATETGSDTSLSTESYEIPVTADYKGHWAEKYITELYAEGAVKGCDKEGNFCPDNEISRAELLKLAMNLYGISLSTDEITNPFTDLTKDHWAYDYILTAYELGIVGGYEGNTFKADNKVNRVEAVKILYKAGDIKIGDETYANPFKDIDLSAWYAKYVLKAYAQAVIQGYQEQDGVYFKPDKAITRAETAKVAVSINELLK